MKRETDKQWPNRTGQPLADVGDPVRSIPVLTYHSIDDSGSVLSTSPQIFQRHLAILHEMGWKTVHISDIVDCLWARKGFPPRAVALTFDDGFASVYERAFPLLCRYGFSATVFLVTEYCGGLNAWPGQPLKIPQLPLLQWPQIREMSQCGIRFGAHTKTHPDLRRVSSAQLKAEVCESKLAIEDRLGQRVDSFSYPYGYFDTRVLRVVRGYFEAACSADLAFVREESNPWRLERIDTYYMRSRLSPRHLNSPLAGAYLGMRRALRRLRRSQLLTKFIGILARRKGLATSAGITGEV